MKALLNLFSSGENEQEIQGHQHSHKITHVCYSNSCKTPNDRYICSLPQCKSKHQTHSSHFMTYPQFLSTLSNAKRQMDFRDKIQRVVDEYRNSIVRYVDNILDKSKKTLYEHIDKKFFNKQFLEMHKRYRAGEDYIPCLANLQNTTAQYIYESIAKTIKDREKMIPRVINKEDINLDLSILPDQNIKEIINYSRIDNVKSLLPFKCKLTLKFKASKNNFLTANLHSANIRGPILLVAESYKNKVFGAFCPVMFPKAEQYVEDRKCLSFLFSLDHRIRLPIKQQYKRYAIKGGQNLWFGRGDLVIANECHKGNISWAQIGRAYQLPSGTFSKQNEWLAGSWYFRILEYEIYQVEIQSIRNR